MSGHHGPTWNVARYLATRLRQIGIRHLFGVPGNHLGPFLTEMHALKEIAWIGTPTELGAGYAADGYARLRGVGAAAVTYSVGAFSLLNTVGGAYVEEVPLVVINASPTFEQWLNFRSIGLLTSHMSPRFESNLDAYRQVTADAQVISNSRLAPQQIDGALTACLSARRPVYLEVMESVWTSECDAPAGEIRALDRPTTRANLEMLRRAVEAAVERIRSLGRPILWGGEEIDRLRLAASFEELVDATGIPFCTTIGGKSILSEYHPSFHGVYNGKASLPEVHRIFKEIARCRIGLGTWTTSKNLSGDQALGEDWIVAARDGVTVGSRYFPDVKLGEFIPRLREELVRAFGERALAEDYYALAPEEEPGEPHSRQEFLDSLSATFPSEAPLTYDSFFQRISELLEDATQGAWPELTSPYVVVSDAAFALLGAQNLSMAERRSFFAQNSWLAIGYSVGAASGIKAALPGKRPLVFVGDGSFQETCQEMSTHTRLGLDTVVFVLNNEDFYGIEQMLVHPCYYADQEPAQFYNELHSWNYHRLAEVFGGEKTPMTGYRVRTQGELEAVLKVIAEAENPANRGPILVQVALSRKDYPRAIAYSLEKCR
ncbi:MAG TPA: thiamine pyrophosphate-binding protein [Thermoanaerobaculia bacterium]|jgi:indolepyruvate decarboxylase